MTMTAADLPGAAVGEDGVHPRAVRPRRRMFTTDYKLRVVAEHDAAQDGAKGALLRREGLYSSHVVSGAGPVTRGTGRCGWGQQHAGAAGETPG